ncbi:hypothetical protein ACS5PN_03310 [Roseateles sp. NT4]|uniref:hypothetical protein n=1 Tax=Roseateles sp. NT4 TaxID=3453715 RepID=UPI003EEE589C
MSNDLLIALLMVLVFGLRWGIKRFPKSAPMRLLFTWTGPFPADGEAKSSYYRRKTWFVLGWLLLLSAVSALLALAMSASSGFKDSVTALVMMFALALGLGMAILGSLFSALTSFKAAWLGPNPKFVVERTAEDSRGV